MRQPVQPATIWSIPALMTGLALPVFAVPARPSTAPAAPAAQRQTLSVLDKARFRRPQGDLMAVLYAELRKQPGFEEAQVATVPTSYVHSGGAVFSVGAQFATYYGDVDGDKQGEWVVGCYVPVKDPTSTNPLTQDERARIAIFDRDSRGRWKVWTSPGLGYEFAEPAYNVAEVSEGLDELRNLMLPLSLVDVDADGQLEVAYHCRSQSAAVGGLPGVYRWDTRRWVSIAPQADRFSMQDLDGDRRLEVITGTRRIGHGSGDDDVPRVWRWKVSQYRESSSEFPRFYAELTLRYTEYVKRKEQAGEQLDRPAWEKAIQRATLLSGKSTAGRAMRPAKPKRG